MKAAYTRLLLLGLALVAQIAFGEERCIKIFDATMYTGKPVPLKAGILRARVVNPLGAWWPAGASPSQIDDMSAMGIWANRNRSETALTVLDIESWPVTDPNDKGREAVDGMIVIAEQLKSLGYKASIGYYALPPLRRYPAPAEPDSKRYRDWRDANDRLARLVDSVDVLLPSLYAFREDQQEWEKFAVANLREARRLAKGKPVYAFVWPEFHPSNRALSGKYASADFWLAQLQLTAREADGIVLWGGWRDGKRMVWDEKAEWWTQTKRFFAATEICKSN